MLIEGFEINKKVEVYCTAEDINRAVVRTTVQVMDLYGDTVEEIVDKMERLNSNVLHNFTKQIAKERLIGVHKAEVCNSYAYLEEEKLVNKQKFTGVEKLIDGISNGKNHISTI